MSKAMIDLDELEKLEQAATPGPWVTVEKTQNSHTNTYLAEADGHGFVAKIWADRTKSKENAALVLATRNRLKDIIKEMRELRAERIASAQLIEALSLAMQDEKKALSAYFSRYGVEHSDDACPQDDTCECDAHPKLSAAWVQLSKLETDAHDHTLKARRLGLLGESE